MKNEFLKVLLIFAFVALVAWLGFSIAKCIAESDLNPWLKAWFLFGGK